MGCEVTEHAACDLARNAAVDRDLGTRDTLDDGSHRLFFDIDLIHHDGVVWLVVTVARYGCDRVDDIQALGHLAKFCIAWRQRVIDVHYEEL